MSSVIKKATESYKSLCITHNTGKLILEELELSPMIVDEFYNHNHVYMSIPLVPTPTIRPLSDTECKVGELLEKKHGVKIIHAIMHASRQCQLLHSYLCIDRGITMDQMPLFVYPVMGDGKRFFKIKCITIDPSKEFPLRTYCGPDTVELVRIDSRLCLIKPK